MIMVEIATIAATWKAHLPRNPGTRRMCRTNAYTMTETKAQVSFGSQLQYLPQDSLAQIPPRKVPTVRAYNPMVSDISETIVSSFIVLSLCWLYNFFEARI